MSNFNNNLTKECSKCLGSGVVKKDSSSKTCPSCFGAGQVARRKTDQFGSSKITRTKYEKPGFFGSLDLASKILMGSLRLLTKYPKLILPLLPILFLVLLLEYSLFLESSWMGFGLFLLAVAVVAYCLMLSFAVCSQMLKQIHDGEEPSITDALLSADMLRLAVRVLGLSAVWYFLVLLLVTIELIISSLLNRISDGLGDTVVRAIFGTIADALRMAGFMMVTIMAFEDVGLSLAFKRLRATVADRSVAALGGLFLTKMVTAIIFGFIYVVIYMADYIQFGPLTAPIILVVASLGWLLSMYIEQLFSAGLYIYSVAPDSPLITILLGGIASTKKTKLA